MSQLAERRLLALDDIPPDEGRCVTVDGVTVAVFRCGDTVRAVENRCPHAGGPLADGIVSGDSVTCPLHNRVVDLRTGTVSDWEEAVRVFPVSVQSGVIVLHRE